MTNDEAKTIGLRAVACKGWREMPGMLLRHREQANFRMRMGDAQPGSRMLASIGGPLGAWSAGPDGKPTGAPLTRADLWPDFRDPATLGCLLALVRDAWGDSAAGIDRDCDTENALGLYWFVYLPHHGRPALPLRRNEACDDGRFPTEAEALVAALEAV